MAVVATAVGVPVMVQVLVSKARPAGIAGVKTRVFTLKSVNVLTGIT